MFFGAFGIPLEMLLHCSSFASICLKAVMRYILGCRKYTKHMKISYRQLSDAASIDECSCLR